MLPRSLTASSRACLHRAASTAGVSALCAAPAVAAVASSSFVGTAAAVAVPSRSYTAPALPPRRFPRLPLKAGVARTIRWTSPPTFNALLRKFVLQVHPDLFQASPDQAAVNQASLQQLNAFVASLKNREPGASYPPAQKLNLVFYLKKRQGDAEYRRHAIFEGRHLLELAEKQARAQVRTRHTEGERIIAKYEAAKRAREAAAGGEEADEMTSADEPAAPVRGEILENEFHILPMRLRTNGLRCRHMLAAGFREAFLRAGIEGAAAEFVWDPEYWNLVPFDDTAAAAAADKAKAAAEQKA